MLWLLKIFADWFSWWIMTISLPFGAALMGREAVDLWWDSRPWRN